jgi:hypothetical protein
MLLDRDPQAETRVRRRNGDMHPLDIYFAGRKQPRAGAPWQEDAAVAVRRTAGLNHPPGLRD